jgi:SNF2 family DNA or RNA helicase
MKVANTQPFSVVYSIYQHQYLGYLIGAYVVQRNGRGELTLLHQQLTSKTLSEFARGLEPSDIELVKIIDSIQQDAIVKKYNPKKWPLTDFFLRTFDKLKGDKLIQEAILDGIEKRKVEIIEKLKTKALFVMGSDNNPAWKRVSFMPDKVRVYFNFIKQDDGSTHYFPSLKYNTERLQIRSQEAAMLCDNPTWLLLNNNLYHFDNYVDGKKIKPFLTKNNIIISPSVQDMYYRKFVVPLVAQYDVFAQGFEIRYGKSEVQAILTISEQKNANSSLFDDISQNEENTESEVVIDLSFQYGDFKFRFDSFAARANVTLEQNADAYIFHKVKRELEFEKQKIKFLKDNGLSIKQGRCVLDKNTAFAWLQANSRQLAEDGFQVRQEASDGKRYFLGYASIDFQINEYRDWFDVYAVVRFGEFEIPFIDLKNLILSRKTEFTLPNGEIAIIPQTWLAKYSELFAFTEYDPDSQKLLLRRHHVALVQELGEDSLAVTVMGRKLEKLRHFESIDNYPLPRHFNGTLRPYQQAGYNWMRFLNEYRLGGCLADDMGLGKTIQTLALLQSQKEAGVAVPSLLVMPTSLIYNWQLEAQKFTPNLSVFVYTGSNRGKNTDQFDGQDLVLTTYGMIRADIDLLSIYRFNYIILDESQSIKNATSLTTKAVMQLNASHRLILTGTPLENSTMDLWTQMTFVNEGLLGSQSYFKTQFQIPIEKQNDVAKTQRLFALIKPFLLRRHKSQVALDLPPKVENIQYCGMTEEQEKIYEETKSYYRNQILEHIETKGIAKSQIIVLQGLTKLRQLANHPRMIDSSYENESGKLEEVLEKLETILAEKHKILIFSQFVKHLSIIRTHLDKVQTKYAYLDGATTNRQAQVELFQTDESTPIFLISLKAGGVGLNLTAADYVFILDPWWNPAIEAQAIDRAHRIGQEKTVFTYKFITKNTVEEKILRLQRGKQKLFNELITNEEGFVKALNRDDVLSLLD